MPPRPHEPDDTAPDDAPDAPRPTASFEQTLRVGPEDLDEQAHVNNVVYVRWVQDAATAHWLALAPPAARAELAWVALRHEIDYLRPALLGDELVVRTTVGHAERLTFERHTEIRRPRDGQLLVRSRTLWCPVDPRTGRPRRVTPEVRALFSAALGETAG